FQQRGEADVAVARVVVDDREIARAFLDQRVDELGRHAGGPEAADHHGRAIVNVGDGGGGGEDDLVDHDGFLSGVGKGQADVVFGEARRSGPRADHIVEVRAL